MESAYKKRKTNNVASVDSKVGAVDENILLERFNTKRVKEYINLKSMEKNIPYNILGCERFKTKYGERIILDLEENKLCLPERYMSMADNIIDMLNKKKKYSITNCGEDGRSYKLKLEKVTEDSQPEDFDQHSQPMLPANSTNSFYYDRF